jgi:hypothetical protein
MEEGARSGTNLVVDGNELIDEEDADTGSLDCMFMFALGSKRRPGVWEAMY